MYSFVLCHELFPICRPAVLLPAQCEGGTTDHNHSHVQRPLQSVTRNSPPVYENLRHKRVISQAASLPQAAIAKRWLVGSHETRSHWIIITKTTQQMFMAISHWPINNIGILCFYIIGCLHWSEKKILTVTKWRCWTLEMKRLKDQVGEKMNIYILSAYISVRLCDRCSKKIKKYILLWQKKWKNYLYAQKWNS